MTIKILSPLVANQIAAGEVVERPSSVIKELVENSLDAGSTKIEIEVNEGGRDFIKIRDNGVGIVKDELELALMRHATSKISSVDDLNELISFGFRGEALASIAAVSRLTLTSKPASQEQAWQIALQGAASDPIIKPASHPNGTSIEICDLFFNTPARRRFLKSAKTEMVHITDLFRRLALGNSEVSFILKSNGKVLYNLPSATTTEQQEKRYLQLLGKDFSSSRIEVDASRENYHLHGFISPAPSKENSDPEIQYFYLNGRMVRDKNIIHAIKQAYSEAYGEDVKISYVLYLDMDPAEVDVNVHPTKHEVRFAEARFVHDFIVISIKSILENNGVTTLIKTDVGYHDYGGTDNSNGELSEHTCFNGRDNLSSFDKSTNNTYRGSLGSAKDYFSSSQYQDQTSKVSPSYGGYNTNSYSGATKEERGQFKAYTDWVRSSVDTFENGIVEQKETSLSNNSDSIILYGVHENLACIGFLQKLYALDLKKLDYERLLKNSICKQDIVTLMLPQEVKLDKKIIKEVSDKLVSLTDIGFTLTIKNSNSINIISVPSIFRGYDLSAIVASLLEFLSVSDHSMDEAYTYIISKAIEHRNYSLADAVQIIYYSDLNVPDYFDNSNIVTELSISKILLR